MNLKTVHFWSPRKLSGTFARALFPCVLVLSAGVLTARAQSTNMATNVTTTTFSNSAPIAIPDFSVASPYPSTIDVPISATVQKLTVTLYGLAHTSPSDIQGIMLVGPTNGPAVELMSYAGDQQPITNVDLTFDDAATNELPEKDKIVSGTYEVSVFVSGDYYEPPAPSYPTTNVLAGFIGTPMQGNWGLYIFDFSAPDTGEITGGWALTITYEGGTTPPPPPQNLTVTSSTVLTNGDAQFTVAGPAGTAFSIESSHDLQNWALVATETMPASGSFTFTSASPSSGDIYYRVIVTGAVQSQAPTLSAASALAAGKFQFTLAGQVSTSYWIEDSTNLQTWTTIATNSTSGSGTLTFTDPTPVAGRRFYRAVVAP